MSRPSLSVNINRRTCSMAWFRGQRRAGYNKTEEKKKTTAQQRNFTHVSFFFKLFSALRTNGAVNKTWKCPRMTGFEATLQSFLRGALLEFQPCRCFSGSPGLSKHGLYVEHKNFSVPHVGGGCNGLSLKDLCCALLYWIRSLHCRGRTLSFLVRSALKGVKNRTKRNKFFFFKKAGEAIRNDPLTTSSWP